MGSATSAGLGSEAPHDQRDIRLVGGHNSDTRPDDIELDEEAKGSEVIYSTSNLDIEVQRLPAPKSYNGAFQRGARSQAKSYIGAKIETNESPKLPAKILHWRPMWGLEVQRRYR